MHKKLQGAVKRVCLWLSAMPPKRVDLNLAADAVPRWISNHAGLYKTYYSAIFVFWKLYSKSTWLRKSERAQINSFEPVIQRAY